MLVLCSYFSYVESKQNNLTGWHHFSDDACHHNFFCNPQATAYFVCEWSMIGCWYKNRSSCVVSTGLLITQIRSKQFGVETLGQVFRFCNQPKQIRVNCVNVGVFDFFELRQRYYWQISTVSDHSDQFRWSLIKSNKTRFISPTIWIELFCDQIRHARCNFLFPLVFHSLRSLYISSPNPDNSSLWNNKRSNIWI